MPLRAGLRDACADQFFTFIKENRGAQPLDIYLIGPIKPGSTNPLEQRALYG